MPYSPYANPLPDYGDVDFDSLSSIRRAAIKSWIPKVVPSTEGDTRFNQLMTHEKCELRRAANPNFTTCGSLPGWLFPKLGLHAALANYGLKGVKDAAISLGCWVKNDQTHANLYASAYGGDQRPLPGDIYLLGTVANPDEILHIGVIVSSTGDRWWTADAGQGEKATQQALYVPHKYNAANRYLDGEHASYAKPLPSRRLIGWVDLDRALEIS